MVRKYPPSDTPRPLPYFIHTPPSRPFVRTASVQCTLHTLTGLSFGGTHSHHNQPSLLLGISCSHKESVGPSRVMCCAEFHSSKHPSVQHLHHRKKPADRQVSVSVCSQLTQPVAKSSLLDWRPTRQLSCGTTGRVPLIKAGNSGARKG